jgi:hypothetical protein
MPVFYTTSPNMQLIVPTVGVELGPTWAQDLNYNFQYVLDQHDHSIGAGVQITPSGLNINSDLTFQNNNLLFIRSGSFVSQPGVLSTQTTLYVSGGNLYYNDNLGNQIQITNSGTVNVPPGIFPGLVAPASVAYNSISSSFIFQSNVNTPAILDVGPIIVRNLVANSFGITLQAPILTTDYTLTLPYLPAVQSFMTLDAAGNIAAPWTVDNSTIKVVSNQLVASIAPNEHAWELNGSYPSLTYPLLDIDSVFFAETAISVNTIFIYSGSNGTSGSTTYDLKYMPTPSSPWVSILSQTGIIDAQTALAPGDLSTTGTGPFVATCLLTNHGFQPGESVTISGVTPSGYNGTFVITAVVPNSSFSFNVGSALGNSTVGGFVATRSPAYTDAGSIIGPQAGITKPIISISLIPAGSLIKWDLLSSMNTGATDARIRIYYTRT